MIYRGLVWVFICQITDFVYGFGEKEMECPSQNDNFLEGPRVLWGSPFRAHRTVPISVTLKKTTIPNAGLGVFSNIFIKKFTWLDKYDGVVLSSNYSDVDSTYTWVTFKNGNEYLSIDGAELSTSNWLRFINCPRIPAEQNIGIAQCYSEIMYMTIKDITPGQELLVYYGDDYAKELGISTEPFNRKQTQTFSPFPFIF